MQSDSYWAGRGNTPGGNYDTFEYQRGQRDAKQWQEFAAPQAPSKSRYREDGAGGGGGAGLAILFVLYVVAIALAAAAVVAIVAAAIALAASVVVVLAARILPGGISLPYSDAFKSAFWGVFGLVAVTCAVWVLTIWLATNIGEAGMVRDVAVTAAGLLGAMADRVSLAQGLEPLWGVAAESLGGQPERRATAAYAAAWLVLPGLLTYAVVLAVRIGGPFGGWLGFVQAFVTAAVSFAPGLVLAAWGGSELAQRAELATLGDESQIWGAIVICSGLVLGYALFGGVIAAVLLAGFAKVLGPPTGDGSFYGTSFLSLLAYGVTTVLASFAYRRGDALLNWIDAGVGSSDWVGHLRANVDSFWPAMAEFWPLQIAGLLVCAAIMAARLRGPYAGVLGYVKACVAAGVIALPLFLPFVALGFLAVRSGALEQF